MTDKLEDLFIQRSPTADRPLLGLTVLVVEDSRFASEALRLMTQRSGARMRRADCLRAAQRHLQTYRPGAVIVDMGLPDGDGADLIRAIRGANGQAPVVLGLSGDPSRREEAMEAGADGFLAKPLESLVRFQQALLAAMPTAVRPPPRLLPEEALNPDPIALRDDLNEAARLLALRPDAAATGYLSQFLSGVARLSRDEPLEHAAQALREGLPNPAALTHAAHLVQSRLAAGSSF
ncbi:response regulator [Sinirhodobacter populi]|uniref:Response regulator n=1 Tax=Paenirhodobacter populi TaxID=2306993 RepID=A0A443K9F6_9RHOB|nr:response regulator [Sinirhodobacter populi]RWR29398.1 response regulator [Sinirhodobacter populi]